MQKKGHEKRWGTINHQNAIAYAVYVFVIRNVYIIAGHLVSSSLFIKWYPRADRGRHLFIETSSLAPSGRGLI